MKKIVFFIAILGFLALGIFTILSVTPVALVMVRQSSIMNFLQRVTGLSLFVLLFVQIILGAFMPKISEKLGGWVFNFHVFEGRLIYILAILHPISLVLFNHYIGLRLDPFVAFINVCLLCQNLRGYYYTIGIVSFWLLSIAVSAAVLRKTNNWLKMNWRKFHVLNYAVFLLVGAHGFLLGTDFRVQPFYTFAMIAYATVVGIIVFIELPRLFKNFRSW